MNNIVKTKKQIDIAHYSSKNQELVKLAFGDIKVLDDNLDAREKTLIFTEYVIKETQVKDANNNDIIVEELQFLRDIEPFTVTYDMWYALEEQIYSQLPDTLSREEKYNIFLKTGIKQVIITEGWYKGQLTQNDFE